MSDLQKSLSIAASGMRVQSERLKVIAENIANAESVNLEGGDPYRRKIISFKNVFDQTLGATVVKVDQIAADPKPFKIEYRPGHPAADAEGYVKMPNVNTMLETADQKEAQRSFEANLVTIDTTRSLISKTLKLLE